MAARCSSSLRLLAQQRPCRTAAAIPRAVYVGAWSTSRLYSTTDDASAPFLSTLKADLKTAMRAKDAPRLAVLRAIMSANLNASKTKQPIRTDAQLVQAIAKMRRTAEESAVEAKQANREDLVAKANEEARLLAEYEKSSGVETVTTEALGPLVQGAIDALVKEDPAAFQKKSVVADVMKRVRQACEGKIVDNKELSHLVKTTVQEKAS
ncbi:uncharacterized protein GMORB2_0308 [Geosmithia morbida]|uniref:Altered inheritance of mitochondria protein 41 n=1 Tax=Geosmithia morbida TaxID=1094350 RepID=A0A9P5D4X4_9HYPO|nr:uncharacterized protein GMORB2_0308 [Geosmithia morbida]KAF4126572.1 uncharacterized protein GMORB2_0308 [Geosmithia morbida]